MATTADTKKTLEEFDNRARELLQLAELNKKKGAKKRAKPTPKGETKKVVEQQFQVPVEKADEVALAEDKLLLLLLSSMTCKNVPPAELLQSFFVTVTPEQIEKLRSVFAPEQLKGLIELWESVKKTGKLIH